MKRILTITLTLAATMTIAAWAGALTLQVGSADSNPEAKNMNAFLVAEMTACMEPAKSVVTANVVQMKNGEVLRTPLRVVQLKAAGTFAVIGRAPAGSVIDLAVTNPNYKNYQPRVLLRGGTKGVDWASVRRFYSTPPSDSDLRSILEAAVD
jgi:hypothetical protein